MTSNTKKLIEAFDNFNQAGQTLSTLWNESSREDKNTIDNIDYPFELSFDETSYKIHNWSENVTELLEQNEVKKHFKEIDNKQTCFVMSLTDREFEEYCHIESGWFYRVTIDEREENTVEIVEENTVQEFSMYFEEFKHSFIVIPKELYDLALLTSSRGINKEIYQIQDFARMMGERM